MRTNKIIPAAAPLTDLQRQAVEKMILDSAVDKRLPCGLAKDIAENLGVPMLAVGQVANALGIRISQCQLGCF